MTNWLSKFFGKFWNLFRTGLQKFLGDNIDDAIRILQKTWIEVGRPSNLKDFKDQVFQEFVIYFKTNRGTWISILIDLAWDSLKNSGKVDPPNERNRF